VLSLSPHPSRPFALSTPNACLPCALPAHRQALSQAIEMFRRIEPSGFEPSCLAIPRHFGIEQLGLRRHARWGPLPRMAPSRDTHGRWKFGGKLNDLQTEATEACLESFDKHRGGVLSLFCGVGRMSLTLISSTCRSRGLPLARSLFVLDI
jgi:hypothetical protein